MNIPGERSEYRAGELTADDVMGEPSDTLARWLRDAESAGVPEPAGFCLATATLDGRPSARFVLLRELDAQGLRFFTHHNSPKGQDLIVNPFAAATFWWAAMERQVRVEGRVKRLSDEDSDRYWASRPRSSQLASAASPQSQPLADRRELEDRMRILDEAYAEVAIPRPPTWGGYLLIPDLYEFWQGRPARLHDRFSVTRDETGIWVALRIAP